jgi:hypothetical protein
MTLGLAGAAQAATSDGIAVANRVAAAIRSTADFQASDFVKPLGESNKSALRRFAACKLTYVNYIATEQPARPGVLVEDPNDVAIGFDCKGVPKRTPAGISLHLQDGKIAKIETHNADLLKVDR